jgi:hypothetical protein
MNQPTRRLTSIASPVTKWTIETAVQVARRGPQEAFRKTLLDHLPVVMTREECHYLTRELLTPAEVIAAFCDPGAKRYLAGCTAMELLRIVNGQARVPDEEYEWIDR